MEILLKETELFRGLEENEIAALLEVLEKRERFYKKGEVVFDEGESFGEIGIVLEGKAVVERSDLWGNNSVLNIVEKGSVFAEAYALSGEGSMVRATATENARILFLNAKSILSSRSLKGGSCDVLVENLISVLAKRSLALSRRMTYISPKSIRGRLLLYFSDCAKKSGGFLFEIPFDRQRLADYLNVDRSAMCGELSKMRKEGIIEYHKNTFKVKI